MDFLGAGEKGVFDPLPSVQASAVFCAAVQCHSQQSYLDSKPMSCEAEDIIINILFSALLGSE